MAHSSLSDGSDGSGVPCSPQQVLLCKEKQDSMESFQQTPENSWNMSIEAAADRNEMSNQVDILTIHLEIYLRVRKNDRLLQVLHFFPINQTIDPWWSMCCWNANNALHCFWEDLWLWNRKTNTKKAHVNRKLRVSSWDWAEISWNVSKYHEIFNSSVQMRNRLIEEVGENGGS